MQMLLISRGGEQTLHHSSLHEGSTGFKRYTCYCAVQPQQNLVMNDDSSEARRSLILAYQESYPPELGYGRTTEIALPDTADRAFSMC